MFKNDGIILVDKPSDWTSFDVVAKIRSELRKQLAETETNQKQMTNDERPKTKLRVGHAGTLDPFATGLLIVLVGDETKKQNEFMKLDKEYEAVFHLGATSNTDDKTGKIVSCHSGLSSSHSEQSEESRDPSALPQDDKPTIGEVQKALKKFTGEIKQVPPRYSAIKVEGKRAYKLARKDTEFEIEPRIVRINELKIKNYEYPRLELTIKCSSGTYIRSLARDLGKELGCGAYVEDLRRTKIGKFDLKEAKKLEELVRINKD
jgi:tRNA pseudouridine55 synthase